MYKNLDELLIELKERIQNLLERENEIQGELSNLTEIDKSVISSAESKRLENLQSELNYITTCKNETINPKFELLKMYVDANNLIVRLGNGITNKSVRTKTINQLAGLLLEIKNIDLLLSYTDEDVSKLQTERNNEPIFENYLNMFYNVTDGGASILINELNAELDKLERKTQSLDKTSSKKIGKIIGCVVLAAGILIGVKSCSKKDGKLIATKATVDDPKATEELVLIDEEPTVVVETIDEAVNDKESDFVRRSNEIVQTDFFEDAYTSDIIELLRAISDKQMWSTENAGYAQAFNTTFNRIVENYLFDTLTEEDINKVEALRSLAKDNSDLDRFLETYTTLLQDILANPYDQSKKDKMMEYVKIFATSLNGFTNEPEVLTADESFNENAQVNDFYNWYFVYDSVIKPTYPIYYPRQLEQIDGMIVEQLMYMNEDDRNAYLESNGLAEYKDLITKQIKLYELQYLMESALVNHPQFCEIRNINDAPELSLGGK